jgi:dipeptidyl aminopeptidase/acylaminoacyl peptidase
MARRNYMTQYQLNDFMNRITVYIPMAVDETGTKLAYTSNLTGSPQIWLGGIDAKVSKLLFPKPITTEKNKGPYIFQESMLFIDSNRLATMKDYDGDEKTFIEIHHLDSGIIESLPRAEGKDYLNFVSKDKKYLYFESTRKDPSGTGLFRYELKTKKIEHFYNEENISSVWCNAADYLGQKFFVQQKGNTANYLKAIHLKTKKVTDVFVEEGYLIYPIKLLPKNKLLVLTNYKRQFMSLATFDLKTKEFVFLGKDLWDIEHVNVTDDLKNIYMSKNVGGKSVIEHLSYPGLKKTVIHFKPNGTIGNLTYNKKTHSLIIGFSSPIEPKNFYRLNLKTKKFDRLTDTWTSIIPENKLSMPTSINYESQGRKIQSWLFLPKTKNKAEKFPVIIWPHGGPQAQERAQFRPILQYFVHQGYAIWAPNHHGSSGFGLDFLNSINCQWGTKDLPDMINGIDWLKKSGKVDPKNISIMGGSYGGYMTLRSITKIPNTFKLAVDIFGPANLFTFIGSVPKDWIPFMDGMVGNAKRDKDALTEQSPIFNLDKIDCPLFVVQGAKDPRVVKSESDQLVEKMKAMKKEVEYLVFDDEGHGFLKIENELKCYQAIADFFKQHQKKK